MTPDAVLPIISISGGDIDVFTDLAEAESYFCYPDALSEELELLDASGQFLRATQTGSYKATLQLDPSRNPAPDYLADQLLLWISRTRHLLDYGDLNPDAAELPELIEAVRTAPRIGPEPTLRNKIKAWFRLGR